jgi:hypothetical protein
MRIQSTLLGWLSKAAPGTNRGEARDASLSLDPVLVNAGRFPFPITRTSGALGTLLAGEKVQGSIIFHRLDVMNVVLALDFLTFPEGVWDVNIFHTVVSRSGVIDLTSDMTLLLQVIEAGVTRFAILSQVVNTPNLNQQNHRQFTLTVTKEIPTNLRLQSAIGLGTGLNVSLFSMVASRIY